MYSQKTINPFNFTDLTMASEVRTIMFTLLVRFDQNRNNQFEEHQIKEALMALLKEDPSEIQYVTRNVFRYDLDNDGVITYEEFVNFCVEHHFGELAIQRLHREGAYTSGARLKMNEEEFHKTLVYALSFIKYRPFDQLLSKLFGEIGPDDKGLITYVQYFLFLKHYFGSKSQAAENIDLGKIIQDIQNEEKNKDLNLDIKPPSQQKSPQAETGTSRHPELNFEQEKQIKEKTDRLWQIISHQVILSLMKYDKERKLCLQINQAGQALKTVFKFTSQQSMETTSKVCEGNKIVYQELMDAAIEYQMCVKAPKNIHELNKTQFALAVKESMCFLRAKPVDIFFQEIFLVFLGGSHSLLTQESFILLMQTMFKKQTEKIPLQPQKRLY